MGCIGAVDTVLNEDGSLCTREPTGRPQVFLLAIHNIIVESAKNGMLDACLCHYHYQ